MQISLKNTGTEAAHADLLPAHTEDAHPSTEMVIAAEYQLATARGTLAHRMAAACVMGRQDGPASMAELPLDTQCVVREKAAFVAWMQAYTGTRTAAITAARAVAASHWPRLAAAQMIHLPNYDSWRKKIESGGILSLAPKYQAGAVRRSLAAMEHYAPFYQLFARFLLHKNQLPLTESYRLACIQARREGLPDHRIPTAKQCIDFAKKLPARVIARATATPEKYKNTMTGYIMREWDCAPGECWVGDHRIIDFWVKVPVPGTENAWAPVRPWLTGWIDAASGYITSFLLYTDTYPNHERILESLFVGIISNGCRPPKIIYTDNGKDYKKTGAFREMEISGDIPTFHGGQTIVAAAMEEVKQQTYTHSIAKSLGAVHKLANPYNGREKPIERSFRDFAMGFDRIMPGYTGNCPANRPDYGREFDGSVANLPTLEQATQALRAYIQIYHTSHTQSRRTAKCGVSTRAEAWAMRDMSAPQWAIDQLCWALMLPQPGRRKIRRGPTGADVHFAGWPYQGATPAECQLLARHYDEYVLVKTSWSAQDRITVCGKQIPARIAVCALDGALITWAVPAQTIPVFHADTQKQEALADAMHKIKAVQAQDLTALNTITGTTRRQSPAGILGMNVGELTEAPQKNGPCLADFEQIITAPPAAVANRGPRQIAPTVQTNCTIDAQAMQEFSRLAAPVDDTW